MELAYLWINKRQDFLEKQGFNFSKDLVFNLNYEENTLFIEDNMNIGDNFFKIEKKSLNRISNLTAIIGDNGAGKSTVLQSIVDSICVNNLFNENDLLIVKDNGKFYIKTNFKFSIKSKSKSYNAESFVFDSKSCQEFLSTISVVHFSNIFDGKDEFNNWRNANNYINISTNNLLIKDYRDFRNPVYERSNPTRDDMKYTSGSNPIYVHRKNDFKRQIYFFRDKLSKLCKISIPKSINVMVGVVNLKSVLNEAELENDDNELTKRLKQADQYFRKINEGKTPLIKRRFAESIFFNLILNCLKEKVLTPDNLRILTFELRGDNPVAAVSKFLRAFFKIFLNEPYYPYLLKLARGNLALLNYLEKLCNTPEIGIFSNTFNFENTTKNKKDIMQLVSVYLFSIPQLDFLEFNWSDLSSGEKALLNFYSRFFEIINKKVNNYPDLTNKILILIDEGDIYLHPQWQRYFVYDVIIFFNRLFTILNFNDISIQIILTSHSPILISDLPKSNIIFLKRNLKNVLEVAQVFDKKQTFASNIHTLYMDSFFMSSTIGKFASYKVNALIDFLKADTPNQEIKDEMKKLLELIGEPIIKTKLEDMWSGKFGLNEEIKILEDKLEMLRKKNDKDK